jgi:hypothetical protein
MRQKSSQDGDVRVRERKSVCGDLTFFSHGEFERERDESIEVSPREREREILGERCMSDLGQGFLLEEVYV